MLGKRLVVAVPDQQVTVGLQPGRDPHLGQSRGRVKSTGQGLDAIRVSGLHDQSHRPARGTELVDPGQDEPRERNVHRLNVQSDDQPQPSPTPTRRV